MDCQMFERQLQTYLDGRLSAPEREALLKHTHRCPECAALLADMEALEALLSRELTLVEPPADFAEQVMAALPPAYDKKAVPLRPHQRKRWLRWGSVAAAAVLLLAVAVSGLWPGGEVENPLPDPNPVVADGGNTPDNQPANPGTLVVPDPVGDDNTTDPEANPDDGVVEPSDETGDNTTDPSDNQENPDDSTATTPPEGDTAPDDGTAVTPDAGENTGETTPSDEGNVVVEPPVTDQPATPIAADVPEDTSGGQSGAVDMPQPAFSSEAVGEFKRVCLAAYESIDAILPSINAEGLVEYYTQYRGNYYQWTQTLDCQEKPKYVNAVTTVPNVASLTDSTDNTSVVGVSAFTAVSPDGKMQAVNLGGANGGVSVMNNTLEGLSPEELASSATYVGSGGGQVLAWAPNSNKFLYTDATGKLYIHYLYMTDNQNATIASAFEGKVSCAVWVDSKTILFAGTPKDSSFSNIYKITVP